MAKARGRLSADPGKPPARPRFERLEIPARGADRREYGRARREQQQRLIVWWLDHMVSADNPWIEKRTLLWHSFWATSVQKVRLPDLMLRQYETLRELGGRDFGELGRAMVRDPALMIWLDAGGNSARSPNENLARELMELFTLGVGHYSENDVRQAARALTGWRIDRRNGSEPAFVPRRHAPGQQTVLGTTADLTDRALADLLVARPESAAHVATRWWGWLVAPAPPPGAALKRLTSAYGSKRDLGALFEAMLGEIDEHGDVLVKQPVEWFVGAMRALSLKPSELAEAAARRGMGKGTAGNGAQRVIGGLQTMGQVPFRPPNVSGWPSGAAWLTTSATRGRIQLSQLLALHARDHDIDQLGVARWSDRTRAALKDAPPVQRLVLALCSPEYTVNP